MPTDRSTHRPPAHLEGRDLLRWQELVRKEGRLLRGLKQMDDDRRIPSAHKEAVILSNERALNRIEAELRLLEQEK